MLVLGAAWSDHLSSCPESPEYDTHNIVITKGTYSVTSFKDLICHSVFMNLSLIF